MVCTQIFGSEFQKHEFKTYSNVFPKRERNLFLNAALILPFKIHLSTEIRQKFQKIHKIHQTSGRTMRYILASRFESTLCRVRKHIVYQEPANKYEFTHPNWLVLGRKTRNKQSRQKFTLPRSYERACPNYWVPFSPIIWTDNSGLSTRPMTFSKWASPCEKSLINSYNNQIVATKSNYLTQH